MARRPPYRPQAIRPGLIDRRALLAALDHAAEKQVPHVFQVYQPLLDEAGAALDRAGQFLTARLAGPDRDTGRRPD